MYIHSVWSWSIISNNEAIPRKVKPKGINELFFIFLNLLIDLIPNNIGMIAAWIWTNNKIKKKKINSQT